MMLAHNFDEGQRTRDVQISQDVRFDTMLLTSNTLKGLKNSGFYKPSPIQLHGIPLGKCGFDLLLEAKSGTGKTAVFSVIALEKLDLDKGLQVVMLAPTREIAAQICDVIKQIGSSYEGLQVEVVMGGLPVQEDIAKFNKKNRVHIVVGSPGRLRHLIHDKYIDISSVRLLVLDEADKLMEKSFQADINYIFSVLPQQKQVIMSSATYPEHSKQFINQYVQNAQHICPDSDSILLGIEQKITLVKHNSNIVRQTKYRFEELLKILSKKQFKQCLIFCNYQARVAELHKMLTREKWPAEQLYGQQAQTDRLDALKTLQEYKCRILISTDLAARGIDASNVDIVINFEPPFEWQTYLHRIGRAGRFGSYGIAVSILSEGKEQKRFKEMLVSINSSLKLGNLWNDDKFEIEDSDASSTLQCSEFQTKAQKPLPINIHPSDKYEKLWETYTSKSTQNTEEIESFEQLCNSFEKMETIIESFTDLLSSFQTFDQHANNNETSVYRHLKMPMIPVREYFTSIKDSREQIRKSSKIEKICKENGKNMVSTLYDNNEDRTFQNTNRKECDKEKYDYIYSVEDTNEHSEYELENPTDALITAGLPTCFSSTKQTNHNRRNKGKHNVTSIDDYNRMTTHSEQKSVRNQKDGKDKNYKNKNTNGFNTGEHSKPFVEYNENAKPNIVQSSQVHDVDEDEDEDYGYNSLSQQYYKSQSNMTYTASTSKRGMRNNYQRQCYNHNISSSSYERTQNYVKWYNQLKFRVQQIELAVYLDEMSKL